MYCKNCGAELPEGADFCPNCGAAVCEANTDVPVSCETETVPTGKYRPLSGWAYWGLALLYAIPIVGFVFLIVFSFEDSNINRRNFTRSYWCWYILVAVLLIILLATGAFAAMYATIMAYS